MSGRRGTHEFQIKRYTYPQPSEIQTMNPYLAGLDLVKQHSGTSGQAALAKCIFSLYNSDNAFSIAEVLGPLDSRYTAVVLAMVQAYADRGETDELVLAGRYVADNFSGLVELSNAMYEARAEVYRKWDAEREEENRRLYPEEYR